MRAPFGGGGGRGRGPSMQHTSRPRNLKRTFKLLGSYLKPYVGLLVLVTVFIIIASLANIIGTFLLQPIIDNVLEVKDAVALTSNLILMACIYVVGTACQYAYNRLMVSISAKILNDVRRQVFDHMEGLPISYFDRRTHGEIMSVYSNDVDSMREMLTRSVPQLISSLVTIIGFLVAMILLNPLLITVSVVQVVVNLLIINFIGKRSRRNFKERQIAIAAVNGHAEEIIEGQKVVKVFSHERQVKEQFDELNEKLQSKDTRANTYASILMPIMGNTAHIFYAITVVLGTLMVLAYASKTLILGMLIPFTAGGLVTFLEYSRRFSMPITNISQQFNSIFHGLAGCERVFNLLEEPQEQDSGTTTLCYATYNEQNQLTECDYRTGVWAWKSVNEQGEVTLTKVEGEVTFDNLTFGYEGDKTVLHDVSLYAHKGQKIAFVGATGAGKTTITNLINRFYEVPDGKIRYDGIDVNQIKKDDLRRSLSMVLQDTHLFTGTVMENIRYGNLEATDEQCIAAARLANADFFISHLPDKYDTLLTSDGANLSQGQRQLLAIARAAVADPPVLILDEATSSIDTRTEQLIEKGMDSLMNGRTVFVIAHRLSTVRNADAIMVLDKGRIIERGNHASLLAKRGKYYELYTGMLELD